MTNGERIQSIFPNITSRLDAEAGIITTKWADNTTKCFKASWWNAEYKEPNHIADAIEKVERRKGLWIPLGNIDDYGYENSYKCPYCGEIENYPNNFCSNCGDKMIGVEEIRYYRK